MTSWLKRTQAGIQSAPTTPAVTSATGYTPNNPVRLIDPNAPDARLDIESRCIYERRLPGNAYITAHVTRLQDGFYDSPSTHGDCINNVRFLALSFVFHPSETINRFQSATVTVSLHDDTDQAFTDPGSGHAPFIEPLNKPKFLRFAPHVLFGGVSPETLDWNFNLTGSLGVAQTPVSASLSPSGGLKGSYKLFQMMRIQGSTRTLLARHHHEYDIEDGEVCWTMEENALQKSGLPREMTFVMLITKGDVENVVFDINIHPKVSSRFGHYPNWWNNIVKYRPLPKYHMDLDRELGQKFEPTLPGRGFNFANLAGTFNDFVSLPGTTYSLTDHAFANQVPIPDAKTGQNLPSKGANVPSRQSTQQSQPASGHAGKPVQPPPRSQTVPPPSEIERSEVPMDYHIYLHNPRTINLHATPPPPQLSTSVSAPGPLHSPAVTFDYPAQQPPIPRPHSTAPTSTYQNQYQPYQPQQHQNQRMSSPANTKLKRRSIDITNVMNSPYYDEPKPTATTTPQRNVVGRSKSGSASGSGSRSGSLRRRRSKTDLRQTPLTEGNTRSSGTTTNSGTGSNSGSRSVSDSSRSRISSSQRDQQKTNISPGSVLSSTSQVSPRSIIIEAPSPPDSGLPGFKARLQAHVASERERERVFSQNQNQNRDRDVARDRNNDRLPFEIKPQAYRPPREMTPSPEPTDDPGSETTSNADAEPNPTAEKYEEQTRAPRQPQYAGASSGSIGMTKDMAISPHHRERVLYGRGSDPMVIPNHVSSPTNINGTTMISPTHSSTGVNPITTSTSTNLRSSTSPSKPKPSYFTNTPSKLPTSPPPAIPIPFPSPPAAYPYPQTTTTTSPSPISPPLTTIPPRALSPYASPKYDSLRTELATQPPVRTRRESSASLSPRLDEVEKISDEDSQPSWGDLKVEAERRRRKRLSMPVGGTGLGANAGNQRGNVVDFSGNSIGGRGYEYIVEADGEWEDR